MNPSTGRNAQSAGVKHPVPPLLAWYSILACVATVPLVTSTTLGLSGLPVYTHDPYHVPKLVTLSALLCVATVAWLLDTLGNRRPLRSGRVFVPFAGFALLVIASTLLSYEPTSSLFGASTRMTGATTWILCAWAFFLVGQYATASTSVREISWALVLGCTIVSVVALAQSLGANPLRIPYAAEEQWMLARGAATLGNPNYTGLLLVLPAVVALGLGLTSSSSWQRRASLTACALMCGATFITLTRAAWIGLVAGLVLFILMTGQDPAARRRMLWTLSGLAVATALVGALLVGPGLLTQRIYLPDQDLDARTSGRLVLASDAVQVVAEHPLAGTGVDRYALGAYQVQSEVRTDGQSRVIPTDPHSLPLLVAATIGVPALLALLAFISMVLAESRSQIGKPPVGSRSLVLYASWVTGLIGFLLASVLSIFTISAVLLLFVAAGVVATPSLRPAASRPAVLVSLATFALVMTPVGFYGAWTSARASHQIALSNVGNSQFHLNRAMAITPWDSGIQVDYLARKMNALRGALAGEDVALAIETRESLDAEIGLTIARFPAELLLYRLRIDLYAASKGYPGYDPQGHLAAIDYALRVFPNDPEFTTLREEVAGDG